MPFTLFVHVWSSDSTRNLCPGTMATVRRVIRKTPGLGRAIVYQPAIARDYYTDDGASPRLALQLYFNTLEALEAAVAADGALQGLADPAVWEGVPGLMIEHQVMYARPYPVIDPVYQPDVGADGAAEPPCAYLVHYPGHAEDFNRWLDYYLDHHPQIMKTFPRIREIEIYTRVGWRDGLPWQRADYMQRNRLIFDSRGALEGALNSPVRHVMRADFENFPPFVGSNIHYPMHAEFLSLPGQGAEG